MKIFSLLILLFFTIHSGATLPDKVLKNRLEHFALGSCNRQNLEQWVWPLVLDRDPSFWLWLGDNVYGDSDNKETMQAKYRQLTNDPGYKLLRESLPVIGIWDDHDYGLNDGGAEFSAKEQNRKLFLDFIKEDPGSKRWTQPGIYTSYQIGPAGQQVKMILLDNRYNRELPGKEADLLGKEQWDWLESELKGSPARIHFIASGITVLTKKSKADETWQKFPASFKKLHDLLEKYKTKGVVFLVGDRHLSTVYNRTLYGRKYTEIMASGITHNKKGFGKAIAQKYYGKKNSLFENNFGEIRIFWEPTIQIEFSAYNRKTESFSLRQKFSLP